MCVRQWTPSSRRTFVTRSRAIAFRPASATNARIAHFAVKGEWFFVPEPSLVVDNKLVLSNEPLRRGAGKPHLVEQLFRTGGETVHVCAKHPNGISEKEYAELLRANPKAVRWGWRVMRRNPGVYARGTVRHSDHDTITLSFWHRVVMNTETQSRTMANVAFLD